MRVYEAIATLGERNASDEIRDRLDALAESYLDAPVGDGDSPVGATSISNSHRGLITLRGVVGLSIVEVSFRPSFSGPEPDSSRVVFRGPRATDHSVLDGAVGHWLDALDAQVGGDDLAKWGLSPVTDDDDTDDDYYAWNTPLKG